MVVEERMRVYRPRWAPLTGDACPSPYRKWRSGVPGCLLGELDTGGQVEFGVDVREVG